MYGYSFHYVNSHVEVLDRFNKFLFSADTVAEAMKEIMMMEIGG